MSIAAVLATSTPSATHLPSPARMAAAQTATAFMNPSRRILTPSPTVPEKVAIRREMTARPGGETEGVPPPASLVLMRSSGDSSERSSIESGGGRPVSLDTRPDIARLADLVRDVPCRDGEGGLRLGGAGALRRVNPRAAELGPDAAHLRDVGHRHATGARLAEQDENGVLDPLAGFGVRREAAVGGGERLLPVGPHHVVADEIPGARLDAVHGRELRDHEALDAEERHRLARGGGLERRDRVLEPGLLQRVGLPRARDPEGGVALQECVLAGAVVDLRVQEAFLVPLVDQGGVLEERRVAQADVGRVEVLGLVHAEDVAAEAREERVHVVGVPGRALGHGEADVARRLLLERERLLLEIG